MRTRAWMAAVLVGCLACGPSAEDVSDGAASRDIPEELVLALLTGAPGESQIFVGSVPAAAEAALPPVGDLSILGGLTRGNDGTVVFEVDVTPEAALSDYEDRIEGEGWERAPDYPALQGGFMPSPRPIAGTWCTDTHWIRVSAASFADRTYLRVRFHEVGMESTPCESAQLRAQTPMGRHGLRLPFLEAPEGATVRMSGGSGSSDSVGMDALVVTGSSTEELFDHYSRQVEEDGWYRGSVTSSDRLAIGTWAARDESGEPAVGVLAVWRLPQAENHRAMIRLERVPGEG